MQTFLVGFASPGLRGSCVAACLSDDLDHFFWVRSLEYLHIDTVLGCAAGASGVVVLYRSLSGGRRIALLDARLRVRAVHSGDDIDAATDVVQDTAGIRLVGQGTVRSLPACFGEAGEPAGLGEGSAAGAAWAIENGRRPGLALVGPSGKIVRRVRLGFLGLSVSAMCVVPVTTLSAAAAGGPLRKAEMLRYRALVERHFAPSGLNARLRRMVQRLMGRAGKKQKGA